MTTCAPASVARRAASTLLAMPPVPTPDVDSPASVPRLARDVAHERDAAAVAVEQALDVGEQHEQVGVDERRDHRRELVVVAELDLLDRDRVVLVDDRHRAALEQRGERVARVVGAGAIGEVGVGEQHLRDRDADLAERVLVALHEHALARGGRGLEPGHVLRARLEPELLRRRARSRRSRR